MTRKMLESCPSCGGSLEITEVECTQCDTQVRSRYRPGPFSTLSEEQTTFLHIFVTSRGNLSDVEKRLGVSYPTVRAKLDEVIQRLNEAEHRSEPRVIEPPRIDAIVREAMERVGASLESRMRNAGERHGSAPPPPQSHADPAAQRRAILEAVSRGELSAADGLQQIRSLGGAR